MGKDLEVSGSGPIIVLSRHLSEGIEENDKRNTVKKSDVLAEMRTEHLQNTS
jgi:uncharacterized protein YpmB